MIHSIFPCEKNVNANVKTWFFMRLSFFEGIIFLLLLLFSSVLNTERLIVFCIIVDIFSSAKDNDNYSWIASILDFFPSSFLLSFLFFFSSSSFFARDKKINRGFLLKYQEPYETYDYCCSILIDSFSSIFTLLFRSNFHQVNFI